MNEYEKQHRMAKVNKELYPKAQEQSNTETEIFGMTM